MKAAKQFRCIALFLFIAGSLSGCSQSASQTSLATDLAIDLAKAYQRMNRDSSQLTLSHITRFGWDRLIVFPPNTATSEIRKSLGIEVPESVIQIGINKRDDIHLMIFLKGKTITQISVIPRTSVDFIKPLVNLNLSNRNAVFAKAGDEKSLALAAVN